MIRAKQKNPTPERVGSCTGSTAGNLPERQESGGFRSVDPEERHPSRTRGHAGGHVGSGQNHRGGIVQLHAGKLTRLWA